MEWQDNSDKGTPPDHRIRCLEWGASCQGTSTGGPWSMQEKTWHINCLEMLAATLALKSFVKDERPIDRQHNSGFLHQQPGGNSIQGTSLVNSRFMDVVPGEEYPHPSSVSPRRFELHSRHGIGS